MTIFDMAIFAMASFDMASFDMASFDSAMFDVPSLDMADFARAILIEGEFWNGEFWQMFAIKIVNSRQATIKSRQWKANSAISNLKSCQIYNLKNVTMKMSNSAINLLNLNKWNVKSGHMRFKSLFQQCSISPCKCSNSPWKMDSLAEATTKSLQKNEKIVSFQMFNLAKKFNYLMQFRIFIKFFTINFVIFDFRQISNILMFSSNQFVPDWSCFESFWTIWNHFEPV